MSRRASNKRPSNSVVARNAGETDGRRGLSVDRVARLRWMARLVASQVSSSEIIHRTREKFGIAESTGWEDLRVVFRMLSEQDAEERPAQRHRMRSSLRALYTKCVRSKDWRGAGFALDRLCKLDGLYEPDKVAVTHAAADEFESTMLQLDPEARAAMRTVAEKVRQARLVPRAVAPEDN